MYEQKSIPPEEKKGKLRLIASPNGGNGGAVKLFQDAELFVSDERRESLWSIHWPMDVMPGCRWRGVRLNSRATSLKAGDGAAVAQEQSIKLAGGDQGSEVLLFDLA